MAGTHDPMASRRTYVARRAPDEPFIDGRVDKSFWEGARWSEDFTDIQGPALPRPRFRTRMKMQWDDQYLYIAAELEDPHVWATLTEHDSVIFRDNDFEVFLDPDGDNHFYVELEINALNTTWDLLLPKPYRDGGPAIDGFELHGLRTAVHVDGTLNDPSDEDQGWSVEIAIPWRSLKDVAGWPCPPRPGDQWRINFSRVQWQHEVLDGNYAKVPGRAEDNWVWSPQGEIDMHQPEKWGVLQFGDTGDEAVLPLPGDESRSKLMAFYHAQKEFRKMHGRWADAEELQFADIDFVQCGDLWSATLGDYRVDYQSRLTRRGV